MEEIALFFVIVMMVVTHAHLNDYEFNWLEGSFFNSHILAAL